VIENDSEFEVRFLQAEGMSQSEILRVLASAYGQNFFSRKTSVVQKCRDGRTALKIIQRNKDADKDLAH
jgi:hypothetical protein